MQTLVPFDVDAVRRRCAGLDIATLWTSQAAHRGSHPFLIWEPFEGLPRSWTYASFHDSILRVAAGLQSRGLRSGDRLLIHLDNCPEWIIAWFACAHLGAVAVTTNTRCAVPELQYFADHAGAVGAITQPMYAADMRTAAPMLTFVISTDTDAGVAAEPESQPQYDDSFERLLEHEPAPFPRPIDPAHPFSVQYTSGTTARPKGVVWTHANALWGAQVGAAHETLTGSDVHLLTLPLFHANAQAYSLLPSLWAGATVVLQPRFSASRFWDVSVRNSCTWTSIVGFCLKALKQHPVPVQHSFRLWGCAFSEPRSDALFGVKTIGWWGMTETVTHGIIGSATLRNRPMSVGRQAAEYDIALVDYDGAPVDDGEVGRLLVRGLPGWSLFAGYLEDPAATAAVFDEGWLDTGDLVRRGPDGWIDFVDRSKDMLKIGGENVAASEIERVIRLTDGVADAAVIGVTHPMLDEIAHAFVVIEPTADAGPSDIVSAVHAMCVLHLADFKRPRTIQIVDHLPESTLGKIAKGQLRSLLPPAPELPADGVPSMTLDGAGGSTC